MKKTRKLTDYIDKVEAAYKEARKAYDEAVKSLDDLEKRHRTKMKMGLLNEKGLKRENDYYYEEKHRLVQSIKNARDSFSASAADIRERVDVTFRDLYCVNPSSMDMQAVEMIRSGMLTERELVEMGMKYKEAGNLAMYRFCGTRFKDGEKSADPAVRQLAIDAHRALRRDDLAVVDSFTNICLRGLRDDIPLANGIDKRHADFYSACHDDAEGISIDVDTPWE